MKTILVVDDEGHVRSVVSRQLTKKGYRVVTASNGEEAIALTKQEQFDLIITDYNMPGINGLELAKALYFDVRHSSVPVLMLTARWSEIAATARAMTNIRQVMDKPFSMQAVSALVEKWIGPGDATTGGGSKSAPRQ